MGRVPAVSSTSGSPSWTTSPSATLTAVTVPATSAMHRDLHLHRLQQHHDVADVDGVAHLDGHAQHVGHHLGEDLDALFAGHGPKLADRRGLEERLGAARLGPERRPGSSVRARRPRRDPVSSRSTRMTTAPITTPEDHRVERGEPGLDERQRRVEEGVGHLRGRGHPERADPPALAAPGPHVGAPHRGPARRAAPAPGAGAPCEGVERPRAPVEQRVDEVGGAVAAQHLGVDQRQRPAGQPPISTATRPRRPRPCSPAPSR